MMREDVGVGGWWCGGEMGWGALRAGCMWRQFSESGVHLVASCPRVCMDTTRSRAASHI